jgi:hypothetical protein
MECRRLQRPMHKSQRPPRSSEKETSGEKGGRTAGRWDNEVKIYRLLRGKAVYGGDDFRFDLEVERDEFLRLAGRAHPRAKGGGVRRGFVMGMMRGMCHGLWIHQPAQDEQAET